MVVDDASDAAVDALRDEPHILKPMSRWSCYSLSKILHYYAGCHSCWTQILSARQVKAPRDYGFQIVVDGHRGVVGSCAVRVWVASSDCY
jgi:hypothetical protein